MCDGKTKQLPPAPSSTTITGGFDFDVEIGTAGAATGVVCNSDAFAGAFAACGCRNKMATEPQNMEPVLSVFFLGFSVMARSTSS